jgi:hypothetical protein
VKYFKNKLDNKKLDFSIFEEFELVKDWLDLLDEKMKIIDYVKTPTSIYEGMQKQLLKLGDVVTDSKGVKSYVKHNPQQLTLIVIDTLNAFKNEKGLNKYDTIELWCANYAKQELKMFYKCSIFNLQQNDKSSTTSQWTNKGERIEDKFLPQLENLQHHKSTSDHHTTVMSIFNPSRFKIGEFEGFNINEIGNNFRWITILKNTHGDEGVNIPLLADNAHLLFEELETPDLRNPDSYRKLYLQLQKRGIEAESLKAKFKLLGTQQKLIQ